MGIQLRTIYVGISILSSEITEAIYPADEDVEGSMQRLNGAGSKTKLHDEGNLFNENLYDTQIVQHADGGAEENNHRQHLENSYH